MSYHDTCKTNCGGTDCPAKRVVRNESRIDLGRYAWTYGGYTTEPPKPRAWALFAPNGNYRLWSTVREEVERHAAEAGAPVTPLYDQATMDAAVAAERERWALHCTAIGDLASQGGDSVVEVASLLERIRVMAYLGPNV